MFMKLEGRRCLVVGAGKVGEPKIGGLIEAGARVHVVALEATEAVHAWAKAGKITLEIRAFGESDLDETVLAVVATRLRSQRTGRVRLWRKTFDNSWNGSLVRGMPGGWQNWERHGGTCWPAILIRSASANCCTR